MKYILKEIEKSTTTLIGYHGTFHALLEKNVKTPIFFSSNINTAGVWAGWVYAYRNRPKGKMYKARIRFNNPFVVDAEGESYGDIKTPEKMRNRVTTETVDTDLIVMWAEKNGYDGVIIKNVFEGNGNTGMGDDYIVIDSKCILSMEEIEFSRRW